MFYFNSNLIYVFFILGQQSFCVSSIGNPIGKIEISAVDDFLEKLIQSSKFDLLIEKIANRAVEKILSSKKAQKDQLHPSLRNVEGNENLKAVKVDKASYSNKGKPGNIDLQAVKSKFSENAYEQLSLKYKHLLNSEVHEATKPTVEKLQPKIVEKPNIQGRHKELKRPPPLPQLPPTEYIESSVPKVIENDKKLSTVDVSYENSKIGYENAKMGYEKLDKPGYDINPKELKEPFDNTAYEGLNINYGVKKNDNQASIKQSFIEKPNRDRPAVDKVVSYTNQNSEFPDKSFGMGTGALVSDVEQKFKAFDDNKGRPRIRRPSIPESGMQKQFRAAEDDPKANANGVVVSEDSSSVSEEESKKAVVEIFDIKARTERANLLSRRRHENDKVNVDYVEYYDKMKSEGVRNKRDK